MDLGTIAAVARRVGPTGDVRAGVERIALNLRALLPLLEGQGRLATAPSQLVADLRSIAAAGDEAILVLPAGAGAARIDAGMRQLAIPATLRDALLALIGTPAADQVRARAVPPAPQSQVAAPAASVEAAAAARAWAVSAQASAAAAVALAGSGTARAVGRSIEGDRAPAPVSFAQPLIAAPEPAAPVRAIAERLRSALERSGLFFESHLAQWAQGERPDEAIAQELLQIRPAEGQVAPAARIAAQLQALQQQAVVLHGPAWPGQPVTIEIARERGGTEHPAADDDAPVVFNATLALDLPRLGKVVARLRLSGETIAATFESARVESLAAALPEFRAGLEAHGLTPVLLQAVEPNTTTRPLEGT
ncbi:MAG: flagellar hook-length control protein FliK [Pseudomonadota bacterium]